ncbi:hypothetical protein EYF80_002147 [Liparis tanakae]|uniref:Uncharacterized protein n=1 Tax=Liparis tanakae TaxID=230148 RepID=A0A4Z2JBC9_9TELE|nr:hypothetical protein EYF80_002147 [Liparis tanakae]
MQRMLLVLGICASTVTALMDPNMHRSEEIRDAGTESLIITFQSEEQNQSTANNTALCDRLLAKSEELRQEVLTITRDTKHNSTLWRGRVACKRFTVSWHNCRRAASSRLDKPSSDDRLFTGRSLWRCEDKVGHETSTRRRDENETSTRHRDENETAHMRNYVGPIKPRELISQLIDASCWQRAWQPQRTVQPRHVILSVRVA